ncbi:hypothetical protein BC827DRAFT_1152543 [Russula dissimulans]|nr:hypothetical protein BC827DRAFT_1152543 [Russula dissimulans]
MAAAAGSGRHNLEGAFRFLKGSDRYKKVDGRLSYGYVGHISTLWLRNALAVTGSSTTTATSFGWHSPASRGNLASHSLCVASLARLSSRLRSDPFLGIHVTRRLQRLIILSAWAPFPPFRVHGDTFIWLMMFLRPGSTICDSKSEETLQSCGKRFKAEVDRHVFKQSALLSHTPLLRFLLVEVAEVVHPCLHLCRDAYDHFGDLLTFSGLFVRGNAAPSLGSSDGFVTCRLRARLSHSGSVCLSTESSAPPKRSHLFSAAALASRLERELDRLKLCAETLHLHWGLKTGLPALLQEVFGDGRLSLTRSDASASLSLLGLAINSYVIVQTGGVPCLCLVFTSINSRAEALPRSREELNPATRDWSGGACGRLSCELSLKLVPLAVAKGARTPRPDDRNSVGISRYRMQARESTRSCSGDLHLIFSSRVKVRTSQISTRTDIRNNQRYTYSSQPLPTHPPLPAVGRSVGRTAAPEFSRFITIIAEPMQLPWSVPGPKTRSMPARCREGMWEWSGSQKGHCHRAVRVSGCSQGVSFRELRSGPGGDRAGVIIDGSLSHIPYFVRGHFWLSFTKLKRFLILQMSGVGSLVGKEERKFYKEQQTAHKLVNNERAQRQSGAVERGQEPSKGGGAVPGTKRAEVRMGLFLILTKTKRRQRAKKRCALGFEDGVK